MSAPGTTLRLMAGCQTSKPMGRFLAMPANMNQVLVVYYSRTGHTRQIAEAIAADCGADLEAIRDARSRRGLLGGLRSAREAWLERLGEIREIEKDPERYD